MGFSSQECWSGLPFSTPGFFSDSDIKLMSSTLTGRFFTTALLGNAQLFVKSTFYYSWKIIVAGVLPIRNGEQKGFHVWDAHRTLLGFSNLYKNAS